MNKLKKMRIIIEKCGVWEMTVYITAAQNSFVDERTSNDLFSIRKKQKAKSKKQTEKKRKVQVVKESCAQTLYAELLCAVLQLLFAKRSTKIFTLYLILPRNFSILNRTEKKSKYTHVSCKTANDSLMFKKKRYTINIYDDDDDDEMYKAIIHKIQQLRVKPN